MIRITVTLSLLWLLACSTITYAQHRNPISPGSGSISISLETATGGTLSPYFSTVLGSNSEAVNGTAFNGGSAMSFKVHSDKPYNIRIMADNGGSTEENSGTRYVNIRDFIFFRIIDNTTQGFTRVSDSYADGERLGSTERTIIANCPSTDQGYSMNNDQSRYKTFSLIFTIKTGYSVPPGYYKTNLLITATYD